MRRNSQSLSPLNAVPTRIVLIIAGLVVGGAEKQLLLLARNLDRKRFAPHIIAFGSGPWEERFGSIGLPVEVLTDEYRSTVAFARCWRRLRQLAPRIVHTLGATANLIGRAAAIAARVPIVIAGERSTPCVNAGTRRLLDHVLSRFTTVLITNSAHAAQFYIKRGIMPASRVRVIHNGIDSIPLASGSRGAFKLGTIGDLRPEKNHRDLINAVARVHTKVPDITLQVAGEGPLRGELQQQIKVLGLESNVALRGYLDDVSGFLSELDLYVHSAMVEGCPNAIMEAMAAGLVCVAYDIPGCAELIRHGETGVLVRAGDWEELAAAIARIAATRSLTLEMGAAGRLRIEREFGIERMVREYAAVYDCALRGISAGA